MTNRLFSSSTVYYLRQLLEEFHRGEIILPRFHRPLVWNTQKRLELFDSIRKGIPLGSFTIWETNAVDIQPMTEFGPFVLPSASKRKPRRYLIDGEQRLMTLYLALYGATMRDDVSLDESLEASFEVFLDLEQQVFVEHDERTQDEPFRSFPLRGIFEFRSTLRFQRQLAREVNGEKQNRYIEQIDGVVEALKECTIAVTTAVTDDLALATEVFKRVNSQGVPMSTAHLVNALTWQGASSLFDAFDDVRESLEAYPHWQSEENLSNELLLLVTRRLVDYDLDEENIADLARALQDPTVIDRLKQSLQKTAAFLHERGLRNPAHIPDEWLLVMLGKVFDKVPEPSEQARDRLEDWLWFIVYTESLDRANRSLAYEKLEVRAWVLAKGKPLSPEVIPSRRDLPPFDFHHPRTKAFAWMVVQRMMKFDNGEAADALAECGEQAIWTVSSAGRHHVASVKCAWRVLCHPLKFASFRAAIRTGNIEKRILKAQVIPPEALSKLREGLPDIKGFVHIREREINEVEEERFQVSLRRLFPPN